MPALATNLSAHKCLLVEDQPRTRDWLHGALTSAFPGISIVTASSLHEAQACLDAASGLGGDFSYQKYTVEDQRYRKVGHAQVIALRCMYGHSGQQLPESAQYKLGGQDTLRGYRDDMFRDNSMFLGTIEYRFPVISKVQGALFTDFGGVWNSGWMPENMHSSIGFGFQIQTPVGPMRIDLAHGSQGNRVHFTVGTTF